MVFNDKHHEHHPTPPTPPGEGAHLPQQPEKPRPPEHPGHPEKPITIIVNGADKKLAVGVKLLTYEDVVKLAYGSYDSSSNIIYSIAYFNGPHENRKGSLVKGDNVAVREGMIFNVGCSNKS